ncbi:MAG: 2Fe-2S iron-sulfur cluster-binding protein [Betaproteobacteria bacterium]
MKIQVNARNRAYRFSVAEGQRILYGGLADGINLPYECGSGTCGTCKARVTAGQIDDLWPEAPGRKYLKQPGEFLMCQCTARGDISLEVTNFVYTADPGACRPLSGRGVVRNPRLLTRDVIAFSIELTESCDFDAGQFMVVQVPGVSGYRGYSMVNFERGAKRLDFLVKKKPGGGASEWLFKGGIESQSVEWFGPLGAATFFPALAKNLLLIAGGSGIAGMMSILSRACQEHYFDQYRGHVFFGVRGMKDAFFLQELAQFQSEFPQKLAVTIALSDEVAPVGVSDYPGLMFDRGFVHEVAARHMKGKYQNMRAYLAGPPPAVDAAIRVLLLEAKLTADNIRYDKFS